MKKLLEKTETHTHIVQKQIIHNEIMKEQFRLTSLVKIKWPLCPEKRCQIMADFGCHFISIRVWK